MPGAEYDGPDREGFMPHEGIAAYFEQYAERFKLPVQYNTLVDSIEPLGGGGYRVRTTESSYLSENVVMATGLEQLPRMPPLAAGLSSGITQLHSSRYRNLESLPPGAVLVVGSAQSGCQIAEELNQAGRQVFLSTGSAGRAPRRYRGKDAFEWLYLSGFFEMTPDSLPVPKEHFAAPHLSGKNGGHTLNLHQFARDGIRLLGHLRGAAGREVSLASDLHENLAKADGFELQVLKMIDGFIRENGFDAPDEELPQLRDGFQQSIVEKLDLNSAGISTVIWATGYAFDFCLVKLEACAHDGFPIQNSGVTGYAGFYFAGMPWMPSLKTGTLAGVGESALHVAARIAHEAAYR